MSDIAKVFRSGNSQGVRLPKAIHFHVDEVVTCRGGDEVVPREKPRSLAGALGRLSPWPDDMEIPDLQPDTCEVL